jgi:protein ImuB
MLWLALRFPLLPLEIYTRACDNDAPLAVVSAAGGNAEIIACNKAACGAGIRPGMSLATAGALACDLQTVARNIQAESAALERLAAWAIQFTPVVSIAPPREILLEIAGSLALFGGLNPLWTQIAENLQRMGYRAVIACAPTPLAAQFFARANVSVRVRHADALRVSLGKLPIEVLDLPPDTLALLYSIGADTIAGCLRLPRDGLARRSGRLLLAHLDRALGQLPDPRITYAPPSRFAAAQPLPAPAPDAQMLLFAARRLLLELCGYLSATRQGVQRLLFVLSHEGRSATCLTLSLVAASRDAEHLTTVLRERLDRTVLPCPVTELTLESELLLPLAAQTVSFFPDSRSEAEAATQLVERVRARLGESAAQGIQTTPDHRPENAWHACEPAKNKCNYLINNVNSHRPLWLLEAPQRLEAVDNLPVYEGQLSTSTTYERIETGWWDDGEIARDYFYASNAREALLWIYRERATGSWFLHGFFA